MQLPIIEAERIKRQMSRTELADLLGVTPRVVANWQSGHTEMPLSKLLMLASSWDKSTDYLLGLRNE